MCGIYLAIAFVAFLIVAVFLDKINVPKEEKMVKRKNQEGTTQTSFLYPFTATFRHFWRSRYQKLLVPITIYSGLEQAFLAGDFTRVSLIKKVKMCDYLCPLSCPIPKPYNGTGYLLGKNHSSH